MGRQEPLASDQRVLPGREGRRIREGARMFTRDAATIARTLALPRVSPKGPGLMP